MDVLSTAALALIAVLNLLSCTVLAADESAIRITANGLPYWLGLAAWAALLWLLSRGCRKGAALSRLRPEATFALCAAAYVLMAAYLLRGINPWRLTGDAEAVYYTAYDLRQGSYSRFQAGGYVGRYPHQIGLVLYEAALMGLYESPALLRWVNLALVLATLLAICCMTMMQPGTSRTTANLTVLLSFAMVPQLLGIVFIYGNVPGLCLMAFSVLALAAWLRGGRGVLAAAAVALASLAYAVRNNMLIGSVAMAALCVMAFLRAGKKRMLAAALCLLLCPLLLTRVMWLGVSRVSGEQPEHGIPSLAWVAMGMQEDGAMPGWYNNYTDRVYYENGYDPQRVEQQARSDIRERLYDFKQDPAMALSFYVRKLITTWCEPTFGAIAISGLRAQEDCSAPLLRSLYGGGPAFTVLAVTMHGLMTLIYALSALYPWLRRRTGAPRSACALFLQVYFIGGFLFHILWETKSLYALCYAVCLVPLAAQSVLMLRQVLFGKKAPAGA